MAISPIRSRVPSLPTIVIGKAFGEASLTDWLGTRIASPWSIQSQMHPPWSWSYLWNASQYSEASPLLFPIAWTYSQRIIGRGGLVLAYSIISETGVYIGQ